MPDRYIPLHLLEPDETLYERCYWLALFVKDLKNKLSAALRENERLEDMLRGKVDAEQLAKELVSLRRENELLERENKRMAKEFTKLLFKRKELKQEVSILRGITEHFQLPPAQA